MSLRKREVRKGDILRVGDTLIKIKAIDYQEERKDGSIDLIFYDDKGKMLSWDSRNNKGDILYIEND